MDKKLAIILVNCLDYAERFLDDCIADLRKQDYQGEIKIFFVNNGTSAESLQYAMKKMPEAEFIINNTNDGFAKGNNDGIKQALMQNFDYVILFNLDMKFEPDCVRKMVEAIENNEMDYRFRPPERRVSGNDKKGEDNRKESEDDKDDGSDKRKIGAVQARLMLHPETDKINSLGNVTHFLGFGYCSDYGRKFQETNSKRQTIKNICYPSGAGVLFRADVLKKIGLFDEEMWMYNEDQDLGWRIWLAGFRCVLAPDAVAYHKYQFSRSITKYYWMDRNRIIAMLKNYRFGTLLLILPAFIVMELGLILFAWKGGWLKEKIKVWQYFFSIKNWRYILRNRQKAQRLRKVKDCDIIPMFSGKIWYQEIDDIKLRLVNPVFNAYWWLVKKIVFW